MKDHLSARTAVDEVFRIPELLELVLTSLPHDTTHQELSSIRSIYSACSTCHQWRDIIHRSRPIRQRLYLSTAVDTEDSKVYHKKSAFPPAQPNPWIPYLLLNQRSWGSAYPFDNTHSAFNLHPSKPKFWTFSFEISRAQYSRLPPSGAWRDMLATSPPFTDCWYTRCFYELGSGRAPFVSHWDYNAKLPKSKQNHRIHSPAGVTLGMIVDAVSELFEKHGNAKFVMVESLRVSSNDFECDENPERPTTKSYLPGSSAEREHGWQRGQY